MLMTTLKKNGMKTPFIEKWDPKRNQKPELQENPKDECDLNFTMSIF